MSGAAPLPPASLVAGLLVAGLGCRRGVGADAVLTLLRRACRALGWDGVPPHLVLATAAGKASEPGLLAAAAALGRPLLALDGAALAAVPYGLYHSRSDAALRAMGVPSVAEGAALAGCLHLRAGRAAGGAGETAARLLLPRLKTPTCTCAIAFGGAISGEAPDVEDMPE